jgi:ectoine hydroxylase-related dioxygenase (phytanoyl-CoA dioxygenase family)
VFDLLEALEEVRWGDVLSDYLGERPALSVKKWTLRRVPVDSGTNWHQDGAFLGSVRTVNLWVALSDCGVTAPTVDVVARRLDHLVETGTGGAFFDWSVGQEVVDRARGDAPIVRPQFQAGDALLFDDYNLHRTATSAEMTDVRYAIESWFFAPSSYPHAQIPMVF